MPVSPSSFSFSRALQPFSQAYLQVRLYGPSGYSLQIATLLDTGASYSAFDQALAVSVGYVLAKLPSYKVITAGGTSMSMLGINNAQLEIEGKKVTAKRILLRSISATPLIATRDVLLRTEFGVDSSDFYFD
jgi:hypothetical protein